MAWGLGHNVISRRLMLAGIVVSAIPDLDVLGFRFGIAYASQFGHRGFTHSLAFALMLALISLFFFKSLQSTPVRTFWFLFVATASHGVLDMFTNGGLGVALLWPFSHARYFASFRPIEVSPIGLSGILTGRGLEVLSSELAWVWLPVMTAAGIAVLLRRLVAQTLQCKGSD